MRIKIENPDESGKKTLTKSYGNEDEKLSSFSPTIQKKNDIQSIITSRQAREKRQKPTAAISVKKQIFLNNPRASVLISSCKIDSIAQMYQEKYGITILKNGGSSLGKILIKNGQNKLQLEFQNKVALFQNESTRYTRFIPAMQFAFILFDSETNEICENLLAPYCVKEGALKADLTPIEVQEIIQLLISNPKLKFAMDQRIDEIVQRGVDVTDYCLTSAEVKQEIAFIQKGLQSDQVAGYMFTNGSAVSQQHFEVILISKNMIIKPITWYQVEKERTLSQHTHGIQGIAWSELMLDSPQLIKKSSDVKLPEAQTDQTGCATHGFLYLKELLRENCHQLKEFTLSFPLNNDTWIFYPSPHVLRYSQSSTYNKLVSSMLTDSEEIQTIQIQNEKSTVSVSTLKKLLQDSIVNAQNSRNLIILEYNRAILRKLPEFRKKWMAAFDQMTEKRKLLDVDHKNRYLAYSSHRLFSKPDGNSIAYTTWESLDVNPHNAVSTMNFFDCVLSDTNTILSPAKINQILHTIAQNLSLYITDSSHEISRGHYRALSLKATMENNTANSSFLLFIIDAYINKSTEGLPKGKMLIDIQKATNGFEIYIHNAANQYADTQAMNLDDGQSAILNLLNSQSFPNGIHESEFITLYNNSGSNENTPICSIL